MQATEVISDRDAEPGKIVHEVRKGELARIGEIPFARYYGTVDATPLFVLLAAAYFERTRDLELLSSIWPNIERALEWIDGYGDCDNDGFIEYKGSSTNGLLQQGWRIRRILFSTPMDDPLKARSRFAKFRHMCTPPSAASRKQRQRLAIMRWPNL
jgi:hypothetical protein